MWNWTKAPVIVEILFAIWMSMCDLDAWSFLKLWKQHEATILSRSQEYTLVLSILPAQSFPVELLLANLPRVFTWKKPNRFKQTPKF